MSPATKLRRGDKEESGQKQNKASSHECTQFLANYTWNGLRPINSKVSLISGNGAVPSISKVFTAVPAHGACPPITSHAAQVQGQGSEVPSLPRSLREAPVSFLQADVTAVPHAARGSGSAWFGGGSGAPSHSALSRPRTKGSGCRPPEQTRAQSRPAGECGRPTPVGPRRGKFVREAARCECPATPQILDSHFFR